MSPPKHAEQVIDEFNANIKLTVDPEKQKVDEEKKEIERKLKEEKRTILLSSHELSEAELICDTVCVMRRGQALKYGPMENLLKEKGDHSLETYFIRMINA